MKGRRIPNHAPGRAPAPKPASYEQFEATLLHCPKCREAVAVRKRLLLVLPHGEKFEYVCARCATTCGEKIESGPTGSVG